MSDDELQLLLELHLPNTRQGPGSDAHTLRALELSGLAGAEGLQVADLGCGTGAATMALAEALDGAQITAVDLFPAFLDALRERAEARGVAATITTLEASMDALPFAPNSLDLIWAEGAIYNMGFEAGVRAWRPLLAPGGVLAVSEITWLTTRRPDALDSHWARAYPEIATASAKIATLEASGYTLLGYFPLPEACWMAHYYTPLRARFPALLAAHADDPERAAMARALIDAEEAEIALYEAHKAHVSYGFYIAQKVGE